MLNKVDDLIEIQDEVVRLLVSPTAREILDIDPTQQWLANNVVGVGIGSRTPDGLTTQQPVFVFLVTTWFPEKALGQLNLATFLGNWSKVRKENRDEHWKKLSTENEAWTELRAHNIDLWAELTEQNVSVIEAGTIGSLGGLAGPVNQLTIGADVAMAGRATHGTVCAFATTEECPKPLLLSCGHVLDSHCGKFRLVTSRGAVVAKISHQAPLLPGHHSSSKFAQQDAVLAELLSDVDPNFELPGHLGRLSSAEATEACHGMRVTKAGKTVTDGEVVCTHATVRVDYPSQVSWLRNQIVVKSREPRKCGDELFAQASVDTQNRPMVAT
jgi:hypothetical protein